MSAPISETTRTPRAGATPQGVAEPPQVFRFAHGIGHPTARLVNSGATVD